MLQDRGLLHTALRGWRLQPRLRGADGAPALRPGATASTRFESGAAFRAGRWGFPLHLMFFAGKQATQMVSQGLFSILRRGASFMGFRSASLGLDLRVPMVKDRASERKHPWSFQAGGSFFVGEPLFCGFHLEANRKKGESTSIVGKACSNLQTLQARIGVEKKPRTTAKDGYVVFFASDLG